MRKSRCSLPAMKIIIPGFPGLKHKWFRCPCGETNCRFCDGGLSLCTVCDGFEGTLLRYCPGYKLNGDALDDVWRTGKVVDFLLAGSRIKAKRMERNG